MTISVPQKLEQLANLYRERNAQYGDNYKWFGEMMTAIFPNGVTLNTVDDFNRFGIFIQIGAKFTRMAAQFENGGHSDSNDDMSVYAQMLDELERDAREERERNKAVVSGDGLV